MVYFMHLSFSPSLLLPAASINSFIWNGFRNLAFLILSHKIDTLSVHNWVECTSTRTSQLQWCLHALVYFIDLIFCVPTCSPCGEDVTVFVADINQPSLPTPFHSVLVSISVFIALSTVFHSINYPDNSPLSHSVLLVLFCLIGPLNYISL